MAWKVTTVGELSVLIRGVNYHKDAAKTIKFDDSIMVLRGGNIQNGKIVKELGDDVYVTERLVKEQQLLKKGDVVIVSSTGSKQLIGKAAHALQDMPLVSFGAFLTVIRPLNKVDQIYFDYFFQTKFYRESIRNASGGVSINNIRKSHLSNIKIPIPPFSEQHKIGQKLEEAEKRIDKIRTHLFNLVELNLRFCQKSLIDPSTSDFYHREKLSIFLEERSERIGSNWQGKKKVGVSAKKGIIDLDTGLKESFNNYKIVYPGDFVYNTMRINIGSIALYEGAEISITSPDYVVFSLKSPLSPRLLLGFLKSNSGLMEINANTKGSVRSRLYLKNLGDVNYPIAPGLIQEQAEQVLKWFSNSLNKLDNSIEQYLDVLFEKVLDKAFKGELVKYLNDVDETND